VPWLDGALAAAVEVGAPPRLAAGEYLVCRGDVARLERPWREWLLEAIGVGGVCLERLPTGPCVRSLAAAPPPGATFACARPVHLLTAIDRLQLGSSGIDPDPAEAAAILADLNRHLDGRGYSLQSVGVGRDWLLACRESLDCTSVDPAEAQGHNLRETMPRGRDGAKVRALMNEIQMLLHEHPVNEARASRREPTINSLWLWGFGSSCQTTSATWPQLFTDDSWLAGIWRAHGQPTRPLSGFPDAAGTGADGAVFAWCSAPADALHEVESRCFEPARRLLSASACSEVAICSGRHVIAMGRWARWRAWRRNYPMHEVISR
jgi:hypothetical protein